MGRLFERHVLMSSGIGEAFKHTQLNKNNLEEKRSISYFSEIYTKHRTREVVHLES